MPSLYKKFLPRIVNHSRITLKRRLGYCTELRTVSDGPHD